MARASSLRHILRSKPPITNNNNPPFATLSFPFSYRQENLKLFSKCRSINHLFQIHANFITSGLFNDPSLATRFLKLSARFGDVDYLLSVFRCIDKRYCANTVIKAFSSSPLPLKAVGFYFEMVRLGFVADSYTFVSLFGACANMGCAVSTKKCHGQAIKHGFDRVLPVQNSLIHVYWCCGDIELARKVFDGMSVRDVASWNSMVNGLLRNGDLGGAHELFVAMPERNVVSWNIMISAYLKGGNPGCCLKLFRRMVEGGFQGNDRTMVCVLSACGRSARLREGRSVHASLEKTLLFSDVVIDTALIDMYCKCKRVDLARRIFDKMACRNLVTWNAMILGHCLHGNPKDGLDLFAELHGGDSGYLPDEVTFVGVLCACARAGMLTEGRDYFTQMVDVFRIKPNFGHLWCMANVYANAGLVREAEEVLKNIQEGDRETSWESTVWANLLSSCRFRGDVALGERIAKYLIEMEPQNFGYYRLLLNIYAVDGQWEGVARVKEMIKERKIGRVPGCGLVDLKEIVHELRIGEDEAVKQMILL